MHFTAILCESDGQHRMADRIRVDVGDDTKGKARGSGRRRLVIEQDASRRMFVMESEMYLPVGHCLSCRTGRRRERAELLRVHQVNRYAGQRIVVQEASAAFEE